MPTAVYVCTVFAGAEFIVVVVPSPKLYCQDVIGFLGPVLLESEKVTVRGAHPSYLSGIKRAVGKNIVSIKIKDLCDVQPCAVVIHKLIESIISNLFMVYLFVSKCVKVKVGLGLVNVYDVGVTLYWV